MAPHIDVQKLCSANPSCSHKQGNCCPDDDGRFLTCCTSRETHFVWGLIFLAAVLTVVLLVLIGVAKVLPTSPKRFQREVTVALVSASVYIAMAVPLAAPSIWQLFGLHMQHDFVYLPFWYAFLLSTTWGSFLEAASCSAKGTVLSFFVMVLFNYVMPGGATKYSRTQAAEEHSLTNWLGNGFHPSVAWILTTFYVYIVFLQRWGQGMKQYALGFFAGNMVEFMNPEGPSSDFSAILWNYKFQLNTSGPVLSSVYVVLWAIPLAAISLPVFPCSRRSRKFFSCWAVAVEGLSTVAQDTWGSLERLITYFSEDDSCFDMERSFLYIGQLEERRDRAEAFLESAAWECTTDDARAQLRILGSVAGMLHLLRQGLRVQLARVREVRSDTAYRYDPGLKPHLNGFVQAMKDAMHYLTDSMESQSGLTEENLHHIMTCASTADTALTGALDALPSTDQGERMFIDCLRNFPYTLESFAKQGIEELEETSPSWRKRHVAWYSAFCFVCRLREQHLHALRNTVSWLLALSWSCFVRRATCVTTVSFVVSPGLGSLFDRNVNRILGVGIGVALGNLPAVLLLKMNCYTDNCYLSFPWGPLSYVMLMFLQWAVSIYGYLATGSKYSYACLLWAGFSGMQMLRSLHTPYGRHGDTTNSALFASTMDNMLGCFIVFGVDILASNLMSSRTTDKVALHISQCLLDVSRLVDKLRGPDPLLDVTTELTALRTSISAARHWDAEAKKEDFTWTTGGLTQYKSDLVDAVLKHVFELHVAMWSLLTVAHRSEQMQRMKNVAREDWPACLSSRCQIYSRVLKAYLASLNGKSNYKEQVEGVAPNPRCDSVRVIADELLDDEEETEIGDDSRKGRMNRAAVAVMKADCRSVRLSLLQLQAVLEENTFWEAKDWRQDSVKEELQEESDGRPRLLHQRSWLRPQQSLLAMWSGGLEDETILEDEEGESEEETSFEESSDGSENSSSPMRRS